MSEHQQEPQRKKPRLSSDIKYSVKPFSYTVTFYDVIVEGHIDCYKRAETVTRLDATFTDEREAYKHAYEGQYQSNMDSGYILAEEIEDYGDIEDHWSDVQDERRETLKKKLPDHIVEAIINYIDTHHKHQSLFEEEIEELIDHLCETFPDEKKMFITSLFEEAEKRGRDYLGEVFDCPNYVRLGDDCSGSVYSSGIYELIEAMPKEGEFTSKSSGDRFEVVQREVTKTVNIPEGYALVKISDLV